MTTEALNIERESMAYDVVVVGGGPAGLATAIHLKQLQPEASVVVLEKGRPQLCEHVTDKEQR